MTVVPQRIDLPGPWVQAFAVELDFPVQSKSNFRRHSTGTTTSNNWARHRDFAMVLNAVLRSVTPTDWDCGPSGRGAKSGVATRPQVVSLISATTLLDSGNLPKSVLDAGEGVVFHNDASVRAVISFTQRRSKDQAGWLAFARLEPGTTQKDLAMATAALVTTWGDLNCPPG